MSGGAPRPGDWRALEDLLALFARAVQQLHTYPPTSPLCVSAIEACGRGLAALDGRDGLTFRVTPSGLMVDGIAVGAGTIVGRELARRLHKAAVSMVTLDRDATPREIARFCEDLARAGDAAPDAPPFAARLVEHGIERITIETAHRPEVLDVGEVPAGAAEPLARERARFDAQLASGEPFNHLYPPHKGWVRLDPGAAPERVSLRDLAILADDPAALASMLLRLTGDAGNESPAEALEKKYSEVALVISSLEPATARRLFARLARAVLDLAPDSRRSLLRRAVLPGLLDGRVDGAILHDFPDLDLAESLCLLLDLEAAAPELLSAALAKLELPKERHEAMLPLLEAKLKEREAAAVDSERHATLARHARELVRIDPVTARSFAEFSAFDLAMDPDAEAALDGVQHALPATDVTAVQLTCLWHLISLEPNPDAVGRFLQRSFSLLAHLEAMGRGAELPGWLSRYRQFAQQIREARPDVAQALDTYLSAFCTPQRAAWLVELALRGPDGRMAADAVLEALGPPMAGPLVGLAGQDPGTAPAAAAARTALLLIGAHIRALAPAIPPLLDGCPSAVRRSLIRSLGDAGPGYEEVIAGFAAGGDEHIAREALRALARLGTPKAAASVAAEVARQRGALGVAAEETLWHFPPDQARRYTRELLGRRDFAIQHPDAAERLLDRAARAGLRDLDPVLHDLAPMRFRIWNPALARVARKAHRMLQPSQGTAR